MLKPIVPRGSDCLCYVTDCCKFLKAYFKCVLGYGVFFLPQNKIVLVEWKSCFIKELLEFSIFAFQWLQITSRAKLITYLPVGRKEGYWILQLHPPHQHTLKKKKARQNKKFLSRVW